MSRCHGIKIFGLQQTKNLTQKVNSPCYNFNNLFQFHLICLEKKICAVFIYFLQQTCIKQFHVAVVQRRLGNVQKSVMHVQSCCFAIVAFFAVLIAVVVV